MTDATPTEKLLEAVAALGTSRVVCVGDVMLDRFVYGNADRVSPEAPIPVFRIGREDAMLGGAGNVVRNLVALGATVDLVSVLGEDDAGKEIASLLDALDSVNARTTSDAARASTLKTRFVAAGQQLLRADREETADISDTAVEDLLDRAHAAMSDAGALMLSDYGKGVLTDDLTAGLIEAARESNLAIIVDPKGTDYRRYRGATLLTPNLKELAGATGLPVGDDDAIVAAAMSVIRQCDVGAVLVTRGADGMTFVAPGTAVHLPAEAREVFDVSGAGDTVAAVMAAAAAANIPPLDAARLSNVAAGVVVGRAGTAIATTEDIRTALHGGDPAIAHDGAATPLESALARIDGWRADGQAIGFTNGCFDLIHPGHISLLEQARAACDRLVVGLNSDASTRRLKGPERPVQSEDARAVVLGSLAAVDLVIVFEDDTPMALIETIRPDVLIKGADYTIDQVVGANVVQGYGGRVVLADLVDGQSTTNTIARLRPAS